MAQIIHAGRIWAIPSLCFAVGMMFLQICLVVHPSPVILLISPTDSCAANLSRHRSYTGSFLAAAIYVSSRQPRSLESGQAATHHKQTFRLGHCPGRAVPAAPGSPHRCASRTDGNGQRKRRLASHVAAQTLARQDVVGGGPAWQLPDAPQPSGNRGMARVQVVTALVPGK